MVARTLPEDTVLESGGTRVVVEYGEDGRARLDVAAHCYDDGSAEAGRLVCEAIHQARLRHADCVACALDASGPACGAILDALHRRVGDDVTSIETRRAGASVMVVLGLQALPAPGPAGQGPAAPGPDAPGSAARGPVASVPVASVPVASVPAAPGPDAPGPAAEPGRRSGIPAQTRRPRPEGATVGSAHGS